LHLRGCGQSAGVALACHEISVKHTRARALEETHRLAGHPEARLTVAAEHAGANSNLLADEELIDPLSGNAVLNGIPVELSPVRSEQAAAVA